MTIPPSYSVHEMADLSSGSKNSIWQWVKEGKLPRPIKFGAKTSRWGSRGIVRAQAAMLGVPQ